jgi:hypothetical protein
MERLSLPCFSRRQKVELQSKFGRAPARYFPELIAAVGVLTRARW